VRFSVIPYRPCREDDSDRAIALAWRLRGKGLTVPWLDVLIAAIAIHDGVRLYAIDAHFQDITKHSGLLLYRPGYGGSYNDVDDG
jgi:predicted nucleic acid-binding protein